MSAKPTSKRPKKAKPRRTKGTGSLWLRGDVWQYRVVLPSGKNETRSTKTGNRALAEQVLANRLRELQLVSVGVVTEHEASVGQQRKKPIGEHLADWEAALEAKGVTTKRVYAATQRARDVVNRCGFETLADIDAGAVDAMVGEMSRQGFSARTVNQRVQAIRQFVRWCCGKGRRLATDPLAGLGGLRVVKQTRQRRPLSPEELWELIDATERAPRYRRLTGPDRSMLYTLAASTGFRAGELASLTPESFDMAGTPPTVTVQAMYSKRRRDDVQPLNAETVAALRPWLADKPKGQPLFDLPDKLPPMLHRDMGRARALLYRGMPRGRERRKLRNGDYLRAVDAAGRVVDFHALRMTYITLLVKSGATVAQAQALARHSDPRLTMNVYTKLCISDTAAAVEMLPTRAGSRKGKRGSETGT